MSMNICGAPCCWGVDDPKNLYLPPWQRVLKEAALEEIGYSGYITIEQERDPRNSDTSLRDVKASVDYLKSVGYAI